MSHIEKKVTVIGGSNLDIVAGYHAMRPSFSDSSEGRISSHAGGVARNIAETLARLGVKTRFISAFGDDEFSSKIIESLTLPRLDIHGCHTAADAPSDLYLTLLDSDGEVLHAINQMQHVHHLTAEYLASLQDQILDSDMIIADCNIPTEALTWLAVLPSRPALYFDGVSPDKIIKLKPILGQFDGLKCNIKEAIALADLPSSTPAGDAMEKLTCFGMDMILLSLGADGVMLYSKGQTHATKPSDIDQIVSVSENHGDALFSGFIFGELIGMTMTDALKLGELAAAHTLKYPGAVNPSINSILSGKAY